MENATKALLIAAAVLVAIIIISITLVIVKQGRETVSGADLSELEVAEFNAPFLRYKGNNVSTDEVNALLNTVFQHNKQEATSGKNRYVAIRVITTYYGRGTNNVLTEIKARLETTNVNDTKTVPKLRGSKYYKVVCNYTGSIISSIEVIEKK